jgi:hypothetical protein
MEKTAVEWLEIELKKKGFDFPYVTLKIEQAKEIEKEQIIKAYNKISMDTAEQYYNKKFNK